jgi:hypothetical protein
VHVVLLRLVVARMWAAQQDNHHQQDNNMLRSRSVNAAADDDADDAKGNKDRPVHGTTNGHDCRANIFYFAIAFRCNTGIYST